MDSLAPGLSDEQAGKADVHSLLHQRSNHTAPLSVLSQSSVLFVPGWLDYRSEIEHLLQNLVPDIPKNSPNLPLPFPRRKEGVEDSLCPEEMALEVLASLKNGQ